MFGRTGSRASAPLREPAEALERAGLLAVRVEPRKIPFERQTIDRLTLEDAWVSEQAHGVDVRTAVVLVDRLPEQQAAEGGLGVDDLGTMAAFACQLEADRFDAVALRDA